MRTLFKSRYFIVMFAVLVLSIYLIYSLAQITVVSGQKMSELSGDKASKTMVLRGERGKILDANGLPLAFNQKSYNIEFYRENIDEKRSERYRPLYSEIMQKTIDIIEKHGGKTIETFNIIKDEAGEFVFYFGDISQEAATRREKNWRVNMQISNTVADVPDTAEMIYSKLRRRFYIPEDATFEQAFKLLSIWQEVQLATYRSYEPVTIAYNVNMETVSEIETRSLELDGMQTSESRVRIYPKSSTAAHVVGYLGKMDPDNAKTLVENSGYSYEDDLGVAGIEKTMENYLTANTKEKKGKRIIETSQSGQIIRTLDTQAPENGFDVVLTLDLALQQVTEDALAKNIKAINADQQRKLMENEEFYSKRITDISKIKMAQMGAAIVMDINTGAVLAIANYPSYDANGFTGGMPKANFDALNADPALPLYNKAISSRAMPGSIFKLLTGVAGLQEGVVTLDTKIDDKSPYVRQEDIGKKLTGLPGCWQKNTSRHQQEDIVKAVKDSCNYYFYYVSDYLGIEKLSKWGTKFGLDTKTNIELPGEVTGQIGGQKVLYDNTKNPNEMARMVRTEIVKLLRSYCEQMGREVTEDQLLECANRLLKLVDDDARIGKDIRVTMREVLGIPEAVSNSNYWHMQISSLLTELRWNPYQTIRTGIGQAVIQVTPIAVARYFSALLNGGVVYDAHIVKQIIDGNGQPVHTVEPTVYEQLNVNPEYLAAIKEGLKSVVSPEDGGTAGDHFKGFEYLEQIGGKTGTAQISYSQNNIDLQNTSWFTAFAPFDNPEIAIIVYIPNGFSGSSSSPTVRDIIKFYLDRKNIDAVENISKINSVTQ